MLQLAVLYDDPQWFAPLAAALDRAGIDCLPVAAEGHAFDPIGGRPPAPVVFNGIVMSAALSGQQHSMSYTAALLKHWAGQGALVLNGADAVAIDASNVQQLALIHRLGLAAPATRVVHDDAAVLPAARVIGFPLVVKADIGGAGAAAESFETLEQLEQAVAAGMLPRTANGIWLVQALVRPRGGVTTRIEVLGGRLLYALQTTVADEVRMPLAAGADVALMSCQRRVRAEPPPSMVAAAQMLAREAGMETCGIEYSIDAVCGTPRIHEIRGRLLHIEDPVAMLGWNPNDRLIERLCHHVRRMGG